MPPNPAAAAASTPAASAATDAWLRWSDHHPGRGPADPYPSTCSISGLSGTITDVNLVLNDLSHTWPDDIDILLVGPQGQDAVVMSDAGDYPDAIFVDLTLDDQAATVLPDSDQLATGSYRPADYEPGDPFPAPAPTPTGNVPFGTFNGTNPNGTWSLYVVDDRALTSARSTAGISRSRRPVDRHHLRHHRRHRRHLRHLRRHLRHLRHHLRRLRYTVIAA